MFTAPARSLYKSLGFVVVGMVPQAGRLPDGTYQDAMQLHYDLTTHAPAVGK